MKDSIRQHTAVALFVALLLMGCDPGQEEAVQMEPPPAEETSAPSAVGDPAPERVPKDGPETQQDHREPESVPDEGPETQQDHRELVEDPPPFRLPQPEAVLHGPVPDDWVAWWVAHRWLEDNYEEAISLMAGQGDISNERDPQIKRSVQANMGNFLRFGMGPMSRWHGRVVVMEILGEGRVPVDASPVWGADVRAFLALIIDLDTERVLDVDGAGNSMVKLWCDPCPLREKGSRIHPRARIIWPVNGQGR